MNIFLLSGEIEKTLLNADRPEFNLMQKYHSSNSEQKIAFVCALIGKVIEQNRMLRLEMSLVTAGKTLKGEGDEQTNVLSD